jgi:hypothetical protein
MADQTSYGRYRRPCRWHSWLISPPGTTASPPSMLPYGASARHRSVSPAVSDGRSCRRPIRQGNPRENNTIRAQCNREASIRPHQSTHPIAADDRTCSRAIAESPDSVPPACPHHPGPRAKCTVASSRFRTCPRDQRTRKTHLMGYNVASIVKLAIRWPRPSKVPVNTALVASAVTARSKIRPPGKFGSRSMSFVRTKHLPRDSDQSRLI